MIFIEFLTQEWLLVTILAALILVYAWRERVKNGRPISPHEVTRMLNDESGVLLDVRDKAEFNAGHIPGAIHIPHSKVSTELGQLEQYRDKTLVVADKIGQHAGNVGRVLGQNGFEVRRLSGGIAEWQSQNLPLVK
ncbi:rhodanese-like domain-containing protein [Marinimicrobium sp. ABcell2]|uniref:rhodanese-like domain-containing protein n=1 Tax=Marinimicrobium sp. ABcell2 TaxID=3069751 RepID=UPI0027B58872|nr:rhodanese-like domain-containing protein [Marinimicrobium sp. ABcell2]MDQ2076557.1 rhodanese-like domain-containing protein [Marinimicrobium sp. ABcell2]